MQNSFPHSQSYSGRCLFCSQPGHSIQKCRQAAIWLRAPFRPRIRMLEGDPSLPKHARATPSPAEDMTTLSAPAPSSLPENHADPIPASSPIPSPIPLTSTTPASPSPAASSLPAQHPVAALPSSEGVTLTPQPSSTALSTSLPTSLDSQPPAITAAALPVQATTLPPDDAPLTAPPLPLAALSLHPSDVMRKTPTVPLPPPLGPPAHLHLFPSRPPWFHSRHHPPP
jgi:hypothetical protein